MDITIKRRMLDQGQMGTENKASRLSGMDSPQILLAAAAGLDAAAIAAILKTAGCCESSENERRPSNDDAALLRSFEQDDALDQAKAALAAQSDSTLLLIFSAPVPTIAAAIADDSSPEQALEDWLSRAEEILGIFRQDRRRILLVEHSAAQVNPAGLIKELNQRLNLALTRPEAAASFELAQSSVVSNADPVHLLIADRAFQHSPRVRRVAAELEVSALPLNAPDGVSKIDLSSSFWTYREKSRISPGQVNGLKEENDRLMAQLNQSKEESEDLREENDLLLQQLHHVQEELERYFVDNNELRNKFEEQEKKKIALTNEVQRLTDTEKALRGSLSWKITAPIRFFLKPLMGK